MPAGGDREDRYDPTGETATDQVTEAQDFRYGDPCADARPALRQVSDPIPPRDSLTKRARELRFDDELAAPEIGKGCQE